MYADQIILLSCIYNENKIRSNGKKSYPLTENQSKISSLMVMIACVRTFHTQKYLPDSISEQVHKMKVKFLTYVLKLISVNLNFSVKAMTVWQCPGFSGSSDHICGNIGHTMVTHCHHCHPTLFQIFHNRGSKGSCRTGMKWLTENCKIKLYQL